MKTKIVDILTNDSLLDLVHRCYRNAGYEAAVITEKSGDAMSIRQSFMRDNIQFIRDARIQCSYPTPGCHSGVLCFQNGSRIVFKGVRQGSEREVDEVLYQDKGRAGAYGRRLRKDIDLKMPATESLYKVVESGDDDLYKFVKEFSMSSDN